MTQQLFHEIADGLPPSTIDVDRIIRREKRARAARRSGLLTGAIALAGVLAAGATIGAAPAPDRDVLATGPASTIPQDGFRLVFNTKEEAAATANRLGDAMDKALHHAEPDARWIYAVSYATEVEARPDGQPPKIGFRDADRFKKLRARVASTPRPTLPPQHTPSPRPSRFLPIFEGGQGVEVHGRKGSLKLTIANNTGTGHKTGKFVQTLSGKPWPGESVPPITRFVNLKLAEGRILTITLGNINGQGIDPAPLTSEQLVAIATELAKKIQP
ncbi:hypothetical protein ACIBBG_34290 [Micromonospora chersina]|uniref:hypothetical protein n=1 Tax=Micromonospora chersina TaxID=47854 RepID=UPI003788920B